MTDKTKAFAPDLEVPTIFDRGPVKFKDMTLLERLKVLHAEWAPRMNKHELAAALIVACIEGGVRDKNGIVRLVSRTGLKPGHVGAVLTKERDGVERARWTRDADGRYQGVGG